MMKFESVYETYLPTLIILGSTRSCTNLSETGPETNKTRAKVRYSTVARNHSLFFENPSSQLTFCVMTPGR